ncbi:MAG TPA: AraC family transcriptional regulator ligand-binding domain-containing protein [Polyangiaceae bacterium]|nr:AraC family transcriptional regulator ligand-binding domain-containing protein [Polyangiaceae bacterium]
MTATLSGRLVRPLIEHELLAPIFAEEARRLGLTLADLDEPDARVDYDVMVDLTEFAIRITGDDAMGLHGATFLGTGVFHIVDYMVRTSRNVYEAMQRVGRYSRQLHDRFEMTVERTNEAEIIRFGIEGGLRFPAAFADFCMASLFVGSAALGLPPKADGVFFAHPPVRNVAEYEQLFNSPVHFNADSDHAVFPARSFDTPIPASDPFLCGLLERHADRLLARLPKSTTFAERVRRLLVPELRGGTPTLPNIAAQLELAPRTFRRRLERDGVTFQAILDDLRRDLAVAYLEQPDIELEEAAYLLGYSEASAFRRAFKRWTGKSVTEFRREVVPAASSNSVTRSDAG